MPKENNSTKLFFLLVLWFWLKGAVIFLFFWLYLAIGGLVGEFKLLILLAYVQFLQTSFFKKKIFTQKRVG